MKDAKDLLPWHVTDISFRPYDGFWSMNPSIHFDGSLWRCVLRCCDYAMPGGVTIRSKGARQTGQQTKNAMAILDPRTWRASQIFKMAERDGAPREAGCAHTGYEDMRIFRTDAGGLQGIAASLHLRRARHSSQAGGARNQPPEQVILSFDGDYNIVGAHPIRGDGWSGTPQKNWVPFDGALEPRFLYSIGKGTLFDAHGRVHGDDALVRTSASSSAAEETSEVRAEVEAGALPVETFQEAPSPSERPPERPRERSRSRPRDLRTFRGGGDVRIVRGRRLSLDANATRPTSAARGGLTRVAHGATHSSRSHTHGTRVHGGYAGLRGGTQLVKVGADAWLGVGHEMKFVHSRKFYWHTWYLVDARGKVTATSEPMKLASNGIEFAAGIGIDGDRVVVSFGVDDMECKIGETSLAAVMALLRQS